MFREWSKVVGRLGMTNKFVLWLRFTFTATHTRVLNMGRTVLPLRHRTNDSKNDELKRGWNALFVAITTMDLPTAQRWASVAAQLDEPTGRDGLIDRETTRINFAHASLRYIELSNPSRAE